MNASLDDESGANALGETGFKAVRLRSILPLVSKERVNFDFERKEDVFLDEIWPNGGKGNQHSILIINDVYVGAFMQVESLKELL